MPIKLGKRVQKSVTNHLGWENLEGHYNIDRPTVICISGNGTKNAKAANGMVKMIANNIGVRTENDIGLGLEQSDLPVDFLSVWYEGGFNRFQDSSCALERFNWENGFNEKGETESQELKDDISEIEEFFNENFFDLIVDQNGERLPLDVAMKNVRNINIVSFCYGTAVVDQLGKIMEKKMLEVGYSREEIEQIQGQILNINVAPILKLGKSKFFTISFSAIDDYDIEYRGDEIVHPELVNMPMINGIAGIKQYSGREMAFCVPSLSNGGDSHYSKSYFSVADRIKVGFTDPSFGDALPIIFTKILEDGVENSIENVNSLEYISIPSIDSKNEELQKILEESKMIEYSDFMKKLYKDVKKRNISPKKVITNEEVELNKEYEETLKKYYDKKAMLLGFKKGTLDNLNEFDELQDILRKTEFDNKDKIYDCIEKIVKKIQEMVKNIKEIEDPTVESDSEIDSISDASERIKKLNQGIDYFQELSKAWSEARDISYELVDFFIGTLSMIVNSRVKNFYIKGKKYFGNGVTYKRKEFKEKYPEYALLLKEDSVDFSDIDNIGGGR